MRVDILALQRFYASPLGEAARRAGERRLISLWPNADGLDVLGIGYASPYLARFRGQARRVVAMMPGVLEVAVIGVPDEHSGEVPKVFIVKKDPALTEAMVLEHCKAQLTGYKRPKYVEFRAELPKTNVGKILRRTLRDELRLR